MYMTHRQVCLPRRDAIRVVVCPSASRTGIAEVPV
jgi:hypothetical protein